MRHRHERIQALIRDIAEGTGATRDVAAAELERLARAERAYVMAEFLADGILWLARLPHRIFEWLLAHPTRRRSRHL
ncbi:MAG: hypothetical protein FJX35_00245 [Alphaproteobacteria bacterium]|nr:hypothetical protein [Alphaproteobacteria bacterium]